MELVDVHEKVEFKAKCIEINFSDFYGKYLDKNKFSNIKFVASVAYWLNVNMSKIFLNCVSENFPLNQFKIDLVCCSSLIKVFLNK